MRLLAVAVAGLAVCGSASATPVYYTFSGQVTYTYTYDTGTGYEYNVPLNGLAPGNSATYTFVVDFDQPARYQDGYPSLNTTYTYIDGGGYDYGLASYLSGNAFPRTPLDGTYHNARYDYGYGYSDIGSATGYLFDLRLAQNAYSGDYREDWLQLYSSCSSCGPSFQVGQTFYGQNYRYSLVGGSVSHYDFIESTLTLTSISDTAAVPEPGTMLLLGGGLLGLIRVKRRG